LDKKWTYVLYELWTVKQKRKKKKKCGGQKKISRALTGKTSQITPQGKKPKKNKQVGKHAKKFTKK